jgi:hypothetical protein
MPYHVRASSCGATRDTMAWMRSAIARSTSGIAAIASRAAWRSSAFLRPPRSARSSSARCFIASRSAGLNPSEAARSCSVSLIGSPAPPRCAAAPGGPGSRRGSRWVMMPSRGDRCAGIVPLRSPAAATRVDGSRAWSIRARGQWHDPPDGIRRDSDCEDDRGTRARPVLVAGHEGWPCPGLPWRSAGRGRRWEGRRSPSGSPRVVAGERAAGLGPGDRQLPARQRAAGASPLTVEPLGSACSPWVHRCLPVAGCDPRARVRGHLRWPVRPVGVGHRPS